MTHVRSWLGVVITAALCVAALPACGSDSGSDERAKQEQSDQVRADARRQAQREERIKALERRLRESEKPSSSGGDECTADALTVVSSGGQGAAGTEFAFLRFELRGSDSCTLRGYPGVALLDGGRRFNVNVGRYPADRQQTVQVDASHSAHFGLVYRNVGSDGQLCRSRVTDLEIIPPNERRALPVKLTRGLRLVCLETVKVEAVRSTPVPSAAAQDSPSPGPSAEGQACASPTFVQNLRVQGVSCREGVSVATYFETTGKGHCPAGWTLRRGRRPAATSGVGGSTLNCHRSGSDVFWVEAEG
jgi:hypothetical protein